MERGNDLDLNYPGYWFEKGAQLSLSPALYGLGKELGVLTIALATIGDNSEIQNRLLQTNGIKGVIEHTEFMMRRLASDKDASRLIHDRTCTENWYVNAFSPEAKGRRASNIVEEIEASASQLGELKESLYATRLTTDEPLPGTMRNMPEQERFANATRDFADLKKIYNRLLFQKNNSLLPI
jgi:hypothetical protein